MVEYINKKVYKDTKSYKVLDKDEDNGVATVIEVEKIPTNLIWENRRCINAEEAFSKALGTGLAGFSLKDVYITNDGEGKPLLNIEGAALSLMKERLGECNAFVSLSHEKDYAIAFVVLEKK